jgi:hypothetical protein
MQAANRSGCGKSPLLSKTPTIPHTQYSLSLPVSSAWPNKELVTLSRQLTAL